MTAEDELRKQTRIMVEEKASQARTAAGIFGFLFSAIGLEQFSRHVIPLPVWLMFVLIVAVTWAFARWAGREETKRLSK